MIWFCTFCTDLSVQNCSVNSVFIGDLFYKFSEIFAVIFKSLMNKTNTRAVELPCPTCLISLRTIKKFQFTCHGTSIIILILDCKRTSQIIFFLFLHENICCGYSLVDFDHSLVHRQVINFDFPTAVQI